MQKTTIKIWCDSSCLETIIDWQDYVSPSVIDHTKSVEHNRVLVMFRQWRLVTQKMGKKLGNAGWYSNMLRLVLVQM